MAIAPGTKAPDFSLPATDGRTYSFADVAGSKATLIVFACNHCPYVHAYEPRLFDLIRRHRGAGLGAAFINSNNAVTHPADSFDNMKVRAREVGHPCPYLRDESQDVAKAYAAHNTPEVFLFDAQGVLRYTGGIDDSPYEPDKATLHPLREAIEAVLAGSTENLPATKALGCTIKWK